MARAGCRVVFVEMGCWRCLVLMAVKAMDGGVVGVHDHHRHSGTCRCQRIDVTGGVMASSADAVVRGENVLPTHCQVAV